MTAAEGITKLGFRRWYERQLIESHMYLVTCVLCMMAVAACVELIEWRGPFAKTAFMLGVIVGGAALGIASLRRYNTILIRAEYLGSQSSCAVCKTYGALTVTRADVGEATQTPDGDNTWLRVRCKKCGNEWQMDDR